jgi:hypothetical protein
VTPRSAIAALLACAVGLSGARAYACAVCGCGDPTLTRLGTEQPFAGRVRGSAELRLRSDDVGQPRVDQIRLREQRLDLALAWAPHDRVFLMLTVPLLHRSVEYVNLARRSTWGLGDVELRAKVFVLRERVERATHLVGAVVGVKTPTAPAQRDPSGALLPVELEPGTGSFDPLAALSYAFFDDPWSAYVSVQGTYPTQGREDFRAAPSLRATALGQYQFMPLLALRGGVDTRLDGKATNSGKPDRDSGGFIAFAGGDVLVSPLMDLVLSAGLRIPIVNALSGYHHEGPAFLFGAAYDF